MQSKSEALFIATYDSGYEEWLWRQPTQPGARVAAANSVLDRGWGKADQTHSVDANIQVNRHILEHID